MEIAKSLFYFIVAGFFEIGGGYLVWLALKEDKGPWYLVGRCRRSLFIRYHTYFAGGLVRPRLCGVWRYFYCFVHIMGLAGG